MSVDSGVYLCHPVGGDGAVYGDDKVVYYSPSKNAAGIVISKNPLTISDSLYNSEGVYTDLLPFYGYSAIDSNKDTYTDKVEFDAVAMVTIKYHKGVETIEWGITYLSETGKDYSDYTPGLDVGSTASTSGTSPELLAIEQDKLALEKERREEEKIAHENLHSEEKVTRTDIMGNEEEQIKGYYPAVRAHKVLEAAETQWGLNQVEILRHEVKAAQFDEKLASAGTNSLSDVVFDSDVEYEKISTAVKEQFKDLPDNTAISAEAVQRSLGTYSSGE